MAKAVCFDLGGVVVKTCRSWAEACERTGIPLREGRWISSTEAVDARRAVVDRYQRGTMGARDYFAALARALRGLYDRDEVKRIHDAWLIEDYPGVEALIGELNSTPNIVTACLSNTNAEHWRRLLQRGPTAEFSACAALTHPLASHVLKLAKPELAIYRAAERALGVLPHQILFFDDAAENVEAARQAGWRAEPIDHRADTAREMRGLLAGHGVLPQ